MDRKELNVLLVDDNNDDIFLTKRALSQYDKRFKVDDVPNAGRCLENLRDCGEYDVILLDYSLPGMDGISLLNTIVKSGYNLPIIIVTGQGDERVAVSSMKKGAYDYIIKSADYLKILPVVIEKVIEKFELDKLKLKLEEETIDKKSKLEATLNSTSDGILMVSYTKDNGYFISIANKRFSEIIGIDFDNIKHEDRRLDFINAHMTMVLGYPKGSKKNFIELYDDKSAENIDIIKTKKQVIERHTGPVFDNNKNVIGRIWSYRDVTDRIELEERLKKMSITDSLTKLYNQGYFYEILGKEVDRAKRQNGKLSIILFDIDKFKEYNDTYGHQGGDKILSNIGEIIMSQIRDNVDTGYRYGGDEFTILLPDANIEQAKQVADRIRISFKETSHTTLSLGIAQIMPHISAEDLVKCADKAMYSAKKMGGDSIYIMEV